jgi:hypothetical protein
VSAAKRPAAHKEIKIVEKGDERKGEREGDRKGLKKGSVGERERVMLTTPFRDDRSGR